MVHNFVVHKFVYQGFFVYICTLQPFNKAIMNRAFVYGMSVEGENFTDRVKETKRLKLDFENGINVILISPRRMGKSSIVKKVKTEITDPTIKVVFMDIYDCRNEYDFYNRFASVVIKETMSLSLGITPQNYQPEEILQLPELIAKEQGVHLIICIDEFQQIGEFEDSITVQKRLRGIWQHQRHVSYCLFGSKKHLMTKLFQNRKMPFYQFGEMMYLDKIPTADWVTFICSRFESQGKFISEELAKRICETVENHSSYVQQLAWNVLAETEKETTEQDFDNGLQSLLAQCSGLFEQHIHGLTGYQMNFIRAICDGVHTDFGSKANLEKYNLGTKSNISRIKTALLDRELVEITEDGVFLEDPVFKIWLSR